MSLFTFAKTEFHNLFSRPVTEQYPQKPKQFKERTRGHIENNIDLCILCGMCARKCPSNAITVNRAERTWEIRPFSCVQCGSCVENCPKKCLSMCQSYTRPGPEQTARLLRKPQPAAKPKFSAAPAPVGKSAS
jgi:ech hydrogenase subunit F